MRQRLPADSRVYDRATPRGEHPLASALFLVLLLVAVVVAVSYPLLAVGTVVGLLVRPAWRTAVARGRSAAASRCATVLHRLSVTAGSLRPRHDRSATADGAKPLMSLDLQERN